MIITINEFNWLQPKYLVISVFTAIFESSGFAGFRTIPAGSCVQVICLVLQAGWVDWSMADLGSQDRNQKFLKLMGAGKGATGLAKKKVWGRVFGSTAAVCNSFGVSLSANQ
jgi:hypothetical protein